jgi:hypothetical protein
MTLDQASKLATIATAGRALAKAAIALNMEPEALNAIVTSFAEKEIREKKEASNAAYMMCPQVYDYFANQLSAPTADAYLEVLDAKNRLIDMCEEFAKEKNITYTDAFNTMQVPVSVVKKMVDKVDPSGYEFRKLQSIVVTHIPTHVPTA